MRPRIAQTAEDILQAARICQEAYENAGLANPVPYRIVHQHFLPTTDIFLHDAGVTATLVCEDHPSAELFGLPFAKTTGEVISLASVGHAPKALIETLDLIYARASYNCLRNVIFTIHPHHFSFYERRYGAIKIKRNPVHVARVKGADGILAMIKLESPYIWNLSEFRPKEYSVPNLNYAARCTAFSQLLSSLPQFATQSVS